jgi:hypothetical protein
MGNGPWIEFLGAFSMACARDCLMGLDILSLDGVYALAGTGYAVERWLLELKKPGGAWVEVARLLENLQDKRPR